MGFVSGSSPQPLGLSRGGLGSLVSGWGCGSGEGLRGLQVGCWARGDPEPEVPAAVFWGGGSMGTSHASWSWCYRLPIRNSSCPLQREAGEHSESCRVAQEMGLGGKSCKSQCKAINLGWQDYPRSSASWVRSHICWRQPLCGCDCSLDRGRAAVNLAWQQTGE